MMRIGLNIRELYGGFVTATRTLSILNVPGSDAQSFSSALPWFPAVGALLGFLSYGWAALIAPLTCGGWPEVLAFMVLASEITLTRGLHLDGLSDWADSFGSISDRKRALEIMKDSSVGVFGVLALLTVLLGKWIILTRLFSQGRELWLVGAFIISRTVMVELAATLPYARSEGGTAAAFVSGARLIHLFSAISFSVLLLYLILGWQSLLLLCLGLLTGALFGFHCRRRFGGITGDLLGASHETAGLAVLLGAALGGYCT